MNAVIRILAAAENLSKVSEVYLKHRIICKVLKCFKELVVESLSSVRHKITDKAVVLKVQNK